MKKILALAALVASTTAAAYTLNPTATPSGVSATIVAQDICVGVEHNLRINPRNVFGNTRVHGVMWYLNSKDQYLSFNCWHMDNTQRVPQSVGIIYTTSRESLEQAQREEIAATQRALQAKQTRIRNSGFE